MPEQPHDDQEIGVVLATDSEPNPKDETIASLEGSLESLENRFYEERFIWILVSVVLVDFYVFSNMQNWSAPLVIGILELVGIVILADRCKVDTVLPLIDRITGFIRKTTHTD